MNTLKYFPINPGYQSLLLITFKLSLLIIPGTYKVFSKTRHPYTPNFLPNFSYIYTWDLLTDTHRHPAPVIQTHSQNYFFIVFKNQYTRYGIWITLIQMI